MVYTAVTNNRKYIQNIPLNLSLCAEFLCALFYKYNAEEKEID